ncbi:hypothetical protein [Lacrimispora sp.]|uniref:hypothetical protein n=1 Tax=Lacrimispora sp. TaxID=2719234 RepID=UPI0028AA5CDC|nr:hypothetical protein [Lacrimispora sp.]
MSNSNLGDLRNALRTATPLPDDTAIDTLISPGTYNVYTTIDGKKYRWIVVVDWCNASSVSLSRQTAYYYLGAAPMAPITRYQYNTGSGYSWSQWYSTDLRKKITLADTGVFHITRQNVIEHSDYYAIAITILPTGTPTTDTPMLTFPSQLATCVLPLTTGYADGLTYASNNNQMFYRLLTGTINNTTEIIINGIIPKA